MRKSPIILSMLFAAVSVGAVGAGAAMLLSGRESAPLLVGIMFLFVAVQLIVFFLMAIDRSHTKPERKIIEKLGHSNLKNFSEIMLRLGKLEDQIAQLSRKQIAPLRPKAISPGPTTSQQELTGRQTQTDTQITSPQKVPAVKNTPLYEGPEYLNDQNLSLYLEPIVELASMQTMFYRAELALQVKGTQRVRIIDMAEQIAENDDGAAIDMKLLNHLGPVITRLAQKGRLAGVICPMSQHSFSNQKFLEELTRYLKHHPELARVLVIEISQANLADLSQDGMAGLAFLAQIGATFCLGGAGLESPDLDSLSSLGFRYFDIDYNDNIGIYGMSAFNTQGMAVQLRDQAIAANIQLIGSGLVRKSQYDALNHVLQFGRGPIFSRPRLVRTDFSDPSGNISSNQVTSDQTPSGETKAA